MVINTIIIYLIKSYYFHIHHEHKNYVIEIAQCFYQVTMLILQR